MCAKWIGDAFTGSMYEELGLLKSIPCLRHHPPYTTYSLRYIYIFIYFYLFILE